MKIIPLKHLLLSNISLKAMSLCFGYAFWYIATTHTLVTTTVTIPLCFSHSQDYTITAPEVIQVTLKGKRIDLHQLDTSILAAHINACSLKEGKNGILLKENNLFLPPSISLEHHKPSNIIVTFTKNMS